MKIIQEHNKCIGCGSCVALCSKFWEMGDDGKAKIVESKKIGENYEKEVESAECSRDAADACPVQCIMIE